MSLTLEQRCKKLERSKRWYHKARNAVIVKLGARCCVCGSTENLEIHHKFPLLSSPKTRGEERLFRSGAARVREWKNPNVSSELELRCADCHPRTVFYAN